MKGWNVCLYVHTSGSMFRSPYVNLYVSISWYVYTFIGTFMHASVLYNYIIILLLAYTYITLLERPVLIRFGSCCGFIYRQDIFPLDVWSDIPNDVFVSLFSEVGVCDRLPPPRGIIYPSSLEVFLS